MARVMDECMVKKPKISIVIAMYNIQSYIAECIMSCLHQEGVDNDDYEIIIVNDGSTDNSLSIAEAAINGMKNARIISQNNAGVSVARNTGIDHAKGEYIWFADGDDMVETFAVRSLIDEISKTFCDIYIFNYSSFNKIGVINSSSFAYYKSPLSGKTINEDYGRILPNLVWAALYKREFLIQNNLQFMPDIRHEDDEFTMRANYLAESVMILRNNLYRYRINDSSFMSRIKRDNTESFISLIRIRESHNLFWGKTSSFYNRCRGHRAFLIITARYDSSFNLKCIEKYEQVKYELYLEVLKYSSWKRRLFLCLIILLPEKYIKWLLTTLRWNEIR